MNRRSFLKFLGVGIAACVMPLPTPPPTITGEIGVWQGVKWINRYKPLVLPTVPAKEGGTWSLPMLELERVQMTYGEYMAVLHNETHPLK